MAQPVNLPEHLRQILSEKDWRDPTKSGKAMERLGMLHDEHHEEFGDFSRNHLEAINDVWTKKSVKFSGAWKPWAPLFWFIQCHPWFFTYDPESDHRSRKRLLVGTLLNQEIWACISSRIQFFKGSGPGSNSINLDKDTRLEIEWYEPLNKLFDLEGMPYDDPTKIPGSTTNAQKESFLKDKGSKWDDRQNNYLKSLIFLLEAFPGLIMEMTPGASKPGEEIGQVYKEFVSFPSIDIDEQVDTSLPNPSIFLLEQNDTAEQDSMTAVRTSGRSSSAEKSTTRSSEIGTREEQTTNRATTKTSKRFDTIESPGDKKSLENRNSSSAIIAATAQDRKTQARLEQESSEPTSSPEHLHSSLSAPNKLFLILLALSLLPLSLLLHWLLKTPAPTPTSK